MIGELILIGALTVTAYVPGTYGNGNLGCRGEKIVPGYTCAVSPDMRHLVGTEIFIDGFGWRFVNDVTNKRFTGRIDIAKNDLKKAMDHGVQKGIRVYQAKPKKRMQAGESASGQTATARPRNQKALPPAFQPPTPKSLFLARR